MNNELVLIIDDENGIRKLLEIALQTNDFKTILATNAKEGLAMAASHMPDIILLDIGLPDKNGQEVLKDLREWYLNPIIMLSVLKDEENIVGALDAGANDYLTKPFRTGELLARIRTALRNSDKPTNNAKLVFDDLIIDLNARLVYKNEIQIKLTSTEYAILTLLAKNEGKVLTHHFLLKSIWGPSYSEQTQYLRVFVAQLRKKIEGDAQLPGHIRTESGIGYRFVSYKSSL